MSTSFEVITTHFNPCHDPLRREVAERWRQQYEDVTCYELVFDDDEPELSWSTVIRGRRHEHLMWQKEALLCAAMMRSQARYVAWIDNDIILPPNWMRRAEEKLEQFQACQLFSRLTFLDEKGTPRSQTNTTMSTGHRRMHRAPSGAWAARRDYMRSIGGLSCYSIVGGGDHAFLSIHSGWMGWLHNKAQGLVDAETAWIKYAQSQTLPGSFTYIDGIARHLFHGERQNRQYQTRHSILRKHQYDPATDVTVDPDLGILTFCSDKPEMHGDIARFFKERSQ